MNPLLIGYDQENHPLRLAAEDFTTHIHGIGASRFGKSKLVEWICRELITSRRGFCLIDPHGSLWNDLVRFLSYVAFDQDRGIHLFLPAYTPRIVGFNPFAPGPGDPVVQANRRVQATVKCWGEKNTDETPRLERWLRVLFLTLIEQGWSPEVARYFLYFTEGSIRERLVARLPHGIARSEWEELGAARNAEEFNRQIESTRNRLTRFLTPRQVRRMLGLTSNGLDLAGIIERGEILLVNLQPTDDFGSEEARLVGTLFLTELWEIFKRRQEQPDGRPPEDFFLIIDEFQKFLVPDIEEMLSESAKRGLHLMLFHQFLEQIRSRDPVALAAINTNAQVKIVFGGLDHDDAQFMADRLFPNQIDFLRVKFVLEQTKFRPVYTRESVYSSGRGGAHVSSHGRATTSPANVGWDTSLTTWLPQPTAASETESETGGDVDSWNESELDLPFYRMDEFKEPSSVTHFSLEEQLRQLSDRLMTQSQRHFVIRRPGKPTVAGVTPYVKTWHVAPETMLAYVEQALRKFLPAPQVDRLIEAVHADVLKLLPPDRPGPDLRFRGEP